MSLVFRHAIVRERAPLVNDRGRMVPDWSGVLDVLELRGWAVDAGGGSEDLVNRDGARSAYTLRGPIGADLVRSDRVVLFGERFRIAGPVLMVPGPSFRSGHVLVQLEAWEG